MDEDKAMKDGPDQIPTEKDIKEFQDHLKKSYSEMTEQEKKALGNQLAEAVLEEARIDQVLENFRKIAKVLSENQQDAQKEFNRQAKKLG